MELKGFLQEWIGSWTTFDRFIFMLLAFLAHEIPLWGYTIACDWLRTTERGKKWIIQPTLSVPASLRKKAVRKVTLDLITQPMMMGLFYDICRYRGMAQTTDWEQLPSLATGLLSILFFIAVQSTVEYWIHREFFHHPLFYTRFHKQHHEYHASEPLASEYFSFVESLGNGIIPALAGPLILRSHMLLTLTWVFIRVAESADSHSGFDLPFSPFRLLRTPRMHDYHHSHNVGNYGAFSPFWDWLMGTDRSWRQYMQRSAAKQVELPPDPSEDANHTPLSFSFWQSNPLKQDRKSVV